MTDFSILESLPFSYYFQKNLEVQYQEKFIGSLVCPMPGLCSLVLCQFSSHLQSSSLFLLLVKDSVLLARIVWKKNTAVFSVEASQKTKTKQKKDWSKRKKQRGETMEKIMKQKRRKEIQQQRRRINKTLRSKQKTSRDYSKYPKPKFLVFSCPVPIKFFATLFSPLNNLFFYFLAKYLKHYFSRLLGHPLLSTFLLCCINLHYASVQGFIRNTMATVSGYLLRSSVSIHLF